MDTNVRILVTGGSGFLGSNLVAGLVAAGYTNIVNLDNLSGGGIGGRFPVNPACINIHGDIANQAFVDKIFAEQQFDVVFHLAANGNVPYSDKFPSVDFSANAIGSFNILGCCRKYDIRKVVYSSTAAVYGAPAHIPIDENHPLDPISNYGVTKLYGEKLGFCYHKTYGLPFTALRIFNTYGPWQNRYVLHDLLKKLAGDSKHLQVLGTGEQVRDYSYVEDTVAAFIKAMQSAKAVGRVYNIAGGSPVSIRQLVSLIVKTLNIEPEIEYTGESWKGDIANLTASIDKIKAELDFKPQYDLERGLAKTIDWFRTVYDLPR